jgi:hypothetical protein
MICPLGKAEGSAVYSLVNKLPDNAAKRANHQFSVCRPLDSIQIYSVLVHIP